MPDLPEEAVREAVAAYTCAWRAGVGRHEELVSVVLEAAAPGIAAQARADERRQVAEEIAAEIERVVVSGDFERPKYERGGFLNDARWAARIARQTGEARDHA